MPLLDTVPRELARHVIMPSDDGFDAARRVQNDAIDRHPALIVRCLRARDVVAAVRHAAAPTSRSPFVAGATDRTGSPSTTARS